MPLTIPQEIILAHRIKNYACTSKIKNEKREELGSCEKSKKRRVVTLITMRSIAELKTEVRDTV